MAKNPAIKAATKKAATKKAAAKRSAAKRPSPKDNRRQSDSQASYSREAAVGAFMAEVAAYGWAEVNLANVATRAGIDEAELLRHHASKTSLLLAFQYHIDDLVMEAVDPEDAHESTRNRLFDLLMLRFDLLQPYKAALMRLARELPRDPLAFAAWSRNLRRSMAWILATCGGPDGGWRGRLHANGLVALWLLTARVWLEDDSADLAKTMAALDKNLSRAEQAANQLAGFRIPGG